MLPVGLGTSFGNLICAVISLSARKRTEIYFV
jgi:hypothetical protein